MPYYLLRLSNVRKAGFRRKDGLFQKRQCAEDDSLKTGAYVVEPHHERTIPD